MTNQLNILHVVKTTDGAKWALEQVKVLIELGHNVSIILNKAEGKFYDAWLKSGAQVYIEDLDFPIRNPFTFFKRVKKARSIIKKVSPDIIHSHFFGTTIILRKALKKSPIPLIFQVPGPLHLEHFFFRKWEILSARKQDYWIASSKYIKNLYLKNGISENKIFLSYYGSDYKSFFSKKDHSLREKYNIEDQDIAIGSVSYIYPPKKYLGQRTGLKNHEMMIFAIKKAINLNAKIKGLLIGGQWGEKSDYERKLQLLCKRLSSHIFITGKVPPDQAQYAWNNLDIALHIPKSENCGGVIEPLLCELPVICSPTGGLPEVIIDQKTGFIVNSQSSQEISKKIIEVAGNKAQAKEVAKRGKKLVEVMFDVTRTAKEVEQIYFIILHIRKEKLTEFSSEDFLNKAET